MERWQLQDPQNLVADETSLAAIDAELVRARLKHPGRKHLLAALVEEVGELAQAILQQKPKSAIDKEAAQVAAVAVRIMEEGDAAFDVKDWAPTP